VGEGELMTHDEPCSMAPDDKHDLISGTCSHLPYKLDKLQNDIWRWSDLRRTILICKVVA
ncbi:hypothetical protein K8D16_23455, partial [Citrobacter freundii]|nr:hypothetical protein [Citrobacter freundii]MCO4179070.1 hypothetical protein [Citrobacter freundii]